MKNNAACYWILLSFLLWPGWLSGQSVFVKAYDPLILDPLIESDAPNLLVAGSTSAGNAGTDFAILRVDTTGEVLQSFTYDHDFIDEIKFVRKARGGGYLFGGHSWELSASSLKRDPDSAQIVIGRLDANFQLLFVKTYDFGNQHRGGILTGLAQTNDGGFAFTVLVNANNTNQSLVVVKASSTGVFEQERIFAHNQNLSYPRPSNNLIVKQNGDLVISRHRVNANGDHFAELIGLRDSLLPNVGYIKWRTNYEASAIHAIAYHGGQDSMAIFFQAINGTSYGLAKADGEGDISWGAEELGSLSAVAPPKRVRIKMRGTYIITMVDNRVTFWPGKNVVPRGIANPYQGVMTDVDAVAGSVFLSANIFLNSQRRPILIKSSVNDQTGNCYTYFLQNARFLNLSPVKRSTAPTLILFSSATNELPSAMIRDSLTMRDTLLCVGAGEVWPGDANSDGDANNRDALYVGLAFDEKGPPRASTEQDSAWRATIAVNWFSNSGGLVNGADKKHADCNGDGFIDRRDIRPIFLNYSQSHGKTGFDPCDPNKNYPPLFLEPSRDTVEAGDTLRVWVVAGEANDPVDSLYGISFGLSYDMMLLDTQGVDFRPINSWLNPRDSLLWLEKDFFMDGKTEVALSKAESGAGVIKQNSHGHGRIAYFDIFTVDDIIFKQGTAYEDLHLDIKDVFAITLDETQVCFDIQADTVVIFQKGPNDAIQAEIIDESVSLYPNPARQWVQVHTPALPNQQIDLYDATGRIMKQWRTYGPHHQLSLFGLTPGFYILAGQAEGKRWTKKLVIRE